MFLPMAQANYFKQEMITMNMQEFYQRLAVKPTKAHQRRLKGLTRVSRAQVLNASSETTWLIWNSETPNS